MYRIYKINVPYSCRDYLGRDYAPDFMDVLNAQSALYPEKIAESYVKDIQTPIYKKRDIKWLR